MGIMHTLKERKFDVSLLLAIFGGFLSFLSILSMLAEEGGTGLSNTIADLFGDWTYWLFILGTAAFIVGVFYLLDYIRKARELKKLLAEPGKSKFIQNQDRIEELAWRLGSKFEVTVVDKKKELKIR